MEAAAQQADGYRDGVFWVPLGPVQSTDGIVPAIAQALGFSFYGPMHTAQQLTHYLRQREALLVLDNVEHLLEGMELVAEILRAAPGVRVLATSRTQLGLQGEHCLHLRGLSYPQGQTCEVWETSQVSNYSAVQLFLQSARRMDVARFSSPLGAAELGQVVRVCRMVEGMPLAILLAAAWTDVLPLPEIVERLRRGLDFLEIIWRDLPERHRSMAAAFDVSWRMLTEEEQRAFACLAVFRRVYGRGRPSRWPAQT